MEREDDDLVPRRGRSHGGEIGLEVPGIDLVPTAEIEGATLPELNVQGIELPAVARALLPVEPDPAADRAHRPGKGTRQLDRELDRQRIHPWPAVHVGPGGRGSAVGREGRGSGNEGHTAVGMVEIGRGARCLQILPGAGSEQPGLGDVAQVLEDADGAVVERVVVGGGQHVDARPGELTCQRGPRGHVGSAAVRLGVALVVMQQRLEVDDGDVGGTDL